MTEEKHSAEVYLERISREMTTIRQQLTEGLAYLRDAQSEIPEKMRRFVTYMHDLHDVCFMYESRGHTVPQYVLQEMERCDDRLRQLLEKEHAQGGTFEKVRAEMATDKNNRWDHTRLLPKVGQ